MRDAPHRRYIVRIFSLKSRWAVYVYTGLEHVYAPVWRNEPNAQVKTIPVCVYVGGGGEKQIRADDKKKTKHFLAIIESPTVSLESEGVKAHPVSVADLRIPPGCTSVVAAKKS
jgi:hypothetical protein